MTDNKRSFLSQLNVFNKDNYQISSKKSEEGVYSNETEDWLIFKNSLHEQKYVHTNESDNIAMLLDMQYLVRKVNTTFQVS